MRVISGKCRGTKLVAPEGLHTRPTTDRIKETLFNMIGFDIPGCEFLDLFGGSGAIGIEALSRGAQKVIFTDNNPAAIACINQNLQKTSLQKDGIVYNRDSLSVIQMLGEQKAKFDIIFLDPPYAMEGIDKILDGIVTRDLLKEAGYIILESGSEYEIAIPEQLTLIKQKNYKTTIMSFYERTRV
ncbi:MAG: 16S rRNA (guanine(966)-N(2))-methyltransferase RsmD [Cellulosilyticaceae bacterium]